MRITGVHGVGHYRSEPVAESLEHWSSQWTKALNSSPHFTSNCPTWSIDVAYYADLLLEPGRQSGLDFDAEAESLVEAFIAEWVAPELQPQGRMTWLLRYVADVISQRLGHDSATLVWFLQTFFPEVAAFLRREGHFCPRESIVQRVADRIEGSDIVIAHSLGSVVAYETLWASEIQVPLLVTVGSPLAMNGVSQRLRKSPDGQLSRPQGVSRWVNVADIGDVVAIPINGIARAFRGLDLDKQESIGWFDFHSAAGYLQGSTVAREIQAVA